MAHFCSQCGTRLSGPYCSNCGAPSGDAAVAVATDVKTGADAHTAGNGTTPIDAVVPDGKADLEEVHRLSMRAFAWFFGWYIAGKAFDMTALFIGVPGGTNPVAVFFYLLTSAMILGLALYLLTLSGRGSVLWRRAYCILYGTYGGLLALVAMFGLATLPVQMGLLEFLAVSCIDTGIVISILTVRRSKPAQRRAEAAGQVTQVTLKTEMPNFVLTVVLVLITAMQLWAEISKRA